MVETVNRATLIPFTDLADPLENDWLQILLPFANGGVIHA